MQPLWFSGVCDRLLLKVRLWVQAWPRGEVYATRPWMDKAGNIVQVPTMRVVKLSFHRRELEAAVRILQALRPKDTITTDLAKVLQGLGTCKPSQGGERIVEIATYEKDPSEVLKALFEARDGKQGFAPNVDAAVKIGGKLWE